MASLQGAGVLAGLGQGLNQGVNNYFNIQNSIKDRRAKAKQSQVEQDRLDHTQGQKDELHALTMGNTRAASQMGADALLSGGQSTLDGSPKPGPTLGAESLSPMEGVQPQGGENQQAIEGEGPKNEVMGMDEIEQMAYQAAMNIKERKRILKTMRDIAPKAEGLFRKLRTVKENIDKLGPMMDEFNQFPDNPSKWKTLKGKYENLGPDDAMAKRAKAIEDYQKYVQEYESLRSESDPMKEMVMKYGVPKEALQSKAHLIEWLNKQEGQLNALGANYK